MNISAISFLVSGKPVVLLDDFKLRIVLRSPLFHKVEESGYTFPFDLPLSLNAEKLNYPDRYNLPEEPFECEMQLYGNTFKTGLLYLETINNDTISVYVKIDSLFIQETLDKKINRLNVLPTLSFADEAALTTHMQNKISGLDSHTFFPIHNEKLRDHFAKLLSTTTNLSVTPIINYYIGGDFTRVKSRMKHVNPLTNVEYQINRTDLVVTPFIFLTKYLEELFIDNGTPIKTDFSTEGYDKLVIYNNVLADSGMYRNWADISPVLKLNQHLPAVSLETFLNEINELFSGSFFVKNGQVEYVFHENVIRSTIYTDVTSKILEVKSLSSKLKADHITSFAYSTPDGDGSWDLIQDLDNANIVGAIDDFSDYPGSPSVSDVYFVKNENSYWVYEASDVEDSNNFDWNLYSISMFGIPAGKTEYEFDYLYNIIPVFAYSHELYIVIYQSEEIQGVGVVTMDIPIVDQEVYSSRFPSSEPMEDIRLLIYHGVVGTAPYANQHNVSPSGNQTTSFSLDMNSKDSLYYKNKRNWIDFLNNSMEVELLMKLSLSEIENIDFDKKHRWDGVDFLYKEISFDISRQGISEVEAIIQTITASRILETPATDSHVTESDQSSNNNGGSET